MIIANIIILCILVLIFIDNVVSYNDGEEKIGWLILSIINVIIASISLAISLWK